MAKVDQLEGHEDTHSVNSGLWKVTSGRLNLEEAAQLLSVAPDYLRGGLNLREAAELLGLGISTLRQRALAGEIGYQRDHSAWRFYWWHLADYLEQREHCPKEIEAGMDLCDGAEM